MNRSVIAHQTQLREVIIEKINCRRTGDFHAGASPRVDFAVRAKTLNNNEAYGYLTVKIFLTGNRRFCTLSLWCGQAGQ
ncbi:MAG: hypothetical protein RJR37_14180 [Peptococcaceae bacterium MAG4]|nr:hypothetical protein [Peptococcaceae bacterium MAG4]